MKATLKINTTAAMALIARIIDEHNEGYYGTPCGYSPATTRFLRESDEVVANGLFCGVHMDELRAGCNSTEGCDGVVWVTSNGNMLAVREDGTVHVAGRRHGIPWWLLADMGDISSFEYNETNRSDIAPWETSSHEEYAEILARKEQEKKAAAKAKVVEAKAAAEKQWKETVRKEGPFAGLKTLLVTLPPAPPHEVAVVL